MTPLQRASRHSWGWTAGELRHRWRSVVAYQLFGIRFGFTQGRHSVLVDASNLGDENYRGISWGMDGPGRMITARYTIRY